MRYNDTILTPQQRWNEAKRQGWDEERRIKREYVEAKLSEMACKCHQKVLTLYVTSNNVDIYRLQCLDCGAFEGTKKRDLSNTDKARAIPFNQALRDWYRAEWDKTKKAVWEEAHNLVRQRAKVKQAQEEQLWARRRQEYGGYLRSEAWQRKRLKVLARDKWLCQGCLEERANEVHHLTYDHIFNEFMFELVSLCRSCHERVHGLGDASELQ